MIRQKTIKGPVEIEGTGLQTGKKVKLTLRSSPADSGINFIRVDLPNKPLLNLQSIDLGRANPIKTRRTALGTGPAEVQTTEHLLAALSGLSIDNIVIESDNVEMPGLDGSARDFLAAMKKAGTIEQDLPRKVLKVEEPVWCKDGDRFLAVFPDEDFKISYLLSYNYPGLESQFFTTTVNEINFEKEIAPARTFCLKREAVILLAMGLGKGANYNNTLVIGKSGPVKNAFRFPNEPVRHKVLDLIGDLYILGMPIKGHVVAIKSGHKLNMELVKKLKGTKR